MLCSGFRRDSRGFVLIYFLSFLVSISLLLFLGLSLAQTTVDFRRSLNICRESSLKIMSGQIELLKALKSMNTRALSLQAKRKQAEYKLSMATASLIPPAIAAASAKLAKVIAQQRLFHQRQLYLIEKSKIQMATSTQRTKFLLYKKNDNVTNIKKSGALQLAVRAVPPTSDSPQYIEEFNFLNKQATEFKYEIKPSRFMSNFNPSRYELSCRASIKINGENSWQAQLLN